MSTERVPGGLTAAFEHLSPVVGRLASARSLALAGIAGVLGAYLYVLHEVLVITGDPRPLYYIVAGALLSGTVLARLIRPRAAGALTVAALVGGTYLYITSLPGGIEFLALLAPMLDDTVALVSGLSVLRIVNADVWALSSAPAPVFFAWYLGVRRRYVAASAVGGGALGLVVLTGDATMATTLVGVLGVTVAIAFGDCDRRGERLRNADGVVVVLATMVVLTLFVGVVPGAAGSFVSTEGVGQQETTMESSLVHAGDSLAVAGSVNLSPEVRYTVEADEEAYWRVGAYDRYTGGGWVRSGDARTYEGGGGLEGPPGESRTVEQRYTAETTIATLPAANTPTDIRDVPVPVQVTESGGFQPASPLQEGESYTAESEIPAATPNRLRDAGEDYPGGIEERYTQLPDDTPERIGERTERLVGNADNPYDEARVLEEWFHNNYDYSLNVDRPRGDIADEFLFEMDAGYCTYFATTMVTMLRSQDVPARFVVGYTSGQQVGDDEWVVRGYNSHAWVEVYFPGHGWVEFDPTPPEPREATERQTLDTARDDGAGGPIDTDGTLDSEIDEGTPEPDEDNETTGGDATDDTGEIGEDTSEGLSLPTVPLPTREQVGFGLIVLAGLLVAGRRTGASGRLGRTIWLRRPPTGDPEAVVAGAYHRAVYLRERSERKRRPGETPRQFMAGADGRSQRLAELYERARYGHGVDDADAEEARRALDELLDARSRLPRFLKKRDTKSR